MSFQRMRRLLLGLSLFILTACVSHPIGTPPKTRAATLADSTATSSNNATGIVTPEPFTCADLEAAWSVSDWPQVLNVLQQLQQNQDSCETGSLEAKAYAAHFNYAAALEADNRRAEAIAQYRAALAINTRGREALNALVRLNALPTLPPPACRPGTLPPYSAQSADFVTVADRGFTLQGKPFYLRGLNYYPRHAPWEAFLTSASMTEVAQEFDLIAAAGFNTLRIMLWHDPLFTCAPEEAVPNVDGFTRLDAVIALARERGLRLIVTLNDLPDFYFRPLYTDYARYDAQTAFIVKRYRDEATIMAWDLRNEPDLDFSADGRPATATREAVLQWLTHIAAIVRQNDRQHLITIGWWGDATIMDEVVDFLSFHHWTDVARLAQRLNALQLASRKPIVLEEIGYPAWDQASALKQAELLQEAIRVAEDKRIAGWLIWSAYDFVPAPEQASNPEYFFGLWRSDLTPKPALGVLPLHPQP